MKKKTRKNVEVQESDYFEDCALCQMMKDADKKGRTLSESELKIGFEKMEEKAAIKGEKGFEDQKGIMD